MSACDQLRDTLRSGRPVSLELRAHAGGCGPCEELLAGGPSLGQRLGAREPDLASDEATYQAMWAGLQQELTRERGPRAFLRSRPTWMRCTALAVVLALVAAAHAGGLLRPDIAHYPAARLALELTLPLLVGLLAAVALTWPHSRPGWSASSTVGLIAAGLALPLVSIALGPAHTDHPASLAGAGADLVPRAFGCFVYGSLFAAPPVALAWALDRGPLRRWLLPLTALISAAGALALTLHCPIVHPAHQLVGHFSVGAAALLGVFVWWRRASS